MIEKQYLTNSLLKLNNIIAIRDLTTGFVNMTDTITDYDNKG